MPVRAAPSFPPARLDARDDGAHTIELTLGFLTPMMGGGVELQSSQKPCDPVTPIRVASIRGQLRFWWRACNPARATTIADLQRAEAALWGSTSKPSAVTITVTRQPPSPRSIEAVRSVAYGAFPLKPEQGSKTPPGKLHDFEDSAFVVTIRCPVVERGALEETIAAWTIFGGLGGRTRRGFGALDDRAQRTTPADLLHTLRDRPALVGVPSLAGAQYRLAGRSLGDAREAWSCALFALQDFRQGEGTARPPRARGSTRPGRSRWPEPDQIRRLFGQHATGHEPVHPVRKFPRAAFGLPIIFHFNGDELKQKSITLRPVNRNRLASPLILRPIREGDHYRALALVLQVAGPPLALELDVRGFWKPVHMQLSPAEAKFKPLDEEPSPLTAFLRHFTAKTKP